MKRKLREPSTNTPVKLIKVPHAHPTCTSHMHIPHAHPTCTSHIHSPNTHIPHMHIPHGHIPHAQALITPEGVGKKEGRELASFLIEEKDALPFVRMHGGPMGFLSAQASDLT